MNRPKKNILELTLHSPEENLAQGKFPVLLVLDNVRSLLNVGAMLRTVDALGAEGMVMCGITGTPPHPEIAKTALGAEESVHWRHCTDTKRALEGLRMQGYRILVLEQTHGSVSLRGFRPEPGVRYALVCGNEVHGVDQGVVDMADAALEIEQYGAKHSLNVATSAAIALWELTRAM